MIICPHCSEPVSSGAVLCPFYQHQAICMKHCRKCKHSYEALSAEVRCRYYDDKKVCQLLRDDAIRKASAVVHERLERNIMA